MSQIRRHVADYRQAVEDWFDDFDFEANDTAEEVFKEMQDMWKPKNRFTLLDMLGDSTPDFILWIQDQIDDLQPDDTETITFTPERDERVKKLQEKIIDTEIELSIAREELADIEEAQIGLPEIGIIATIKSFIRNIFRG